MIQENKDVFSGKIGRFKTRQVKIIIDDVIKQVVQKQKRIPYNTKSFPMMSQEHGSVPLQWHSNQIATMFVSVLTCEWEDSVTEDSVAKFRGAKTSLN